MVTRTTTGERVLPHPKHTLIPCSVAQANAVIRENHRHNDGTRRGVKLAVALACGERIVGVVLLSVPSSPSQSDGLTLEAKRGCIVGNHPNANSTMYGALWRTTTALGYHRLLTYTLETESGSSVKAVGFRATGKSNADYVSWEHRENRSLPSTVGMRVPPPGVEKIRWELVTPEYETLKAHPLTGEFPVVGEEGPSMDEVW